MINPDHSRLSITCPCQLVSIARSSFYYRGKGETPFNLELMHMIDEKFMMTPWKGSRQMARHFRRQGRRVSRKRVQRLMRKMGLRAVCQAPRMSKPHPEHRVYPYLLRDLTIDRPNQVWCTDLTYIQRQHGFLYLVAIMGWSTRAVLSWRLSNTMDSGFYIDALKEALSRYGKPEIFNADQGNQFADEENRCSPPLTGSSNITRREDRLRGVHLELPCGCLKNGGPPLI